MSLCEGNELLSTQVEGIHLDDHSVELLLSRIPHYVEEGLVENKLEVSHHLAHAYSAAAQCPFDRGMIVVMDGMGETWRTMRCAVEDGDETYVSDLTLCGDGGSGIEFVPSDIEERAKGSYFDWREAETVYTFTKDDKHLTIKVSQGYLLLHTLFDSFSVRASFARTASACVSWTTRQR